MGRWFWSVSLLAALAAFAWFDAKTPAIVSALVAVALACGFSVWLDRTSDEKLSRERTHGVVVREQHGRVVR
jgi:Flp pilus assembly protein TadB